MAKRLSKFAPVAVVVAIFAVALCFDGSWMKKLPPLCPVKGISGWDCPGCGLTRAFFALFHGEFRQAIRLNAVCPVVALYFGLYLFRALFEYVRKRRVVWFTEAGNRLIGRLFAVLLFGQWIYKTALHLLSLC